MSDHLKSIIGLTRKEYTDNLEAWKRNERRFTAGEDVYDELRMFQWEGTVQAEDNDAGGQKVSPGLASYKARQEAAVCVEFAAMTKEKFGGLVFQNFPKEDSGLSLGKLQSEGDGWRAEALMNNADGTGRNARSLDAFWRDEMEMSMATRYRWIFAEAPEGGASSLAEEEEKRPYFVGFSPTSVPYWYEEKGNLQCVRVLIESEEPKVKEGKVEHSSVKHHYLMTREGFEGWGTSATVDVPFEQGGWWIVDDEGEIVTKGDIEMSGTWEQTNGEIPMAPLFYERGKIGNKDTGITHLGRIQVEFMNQLSAMFYSSWAGGSGTVFFAGADDEQWDTIRKAGLLGGQWIPIPPKTNETGTPANVDVIALSSFDASSSIKTTLEWLLKLATQLILRELTTSPDASGASRQLEFLQGNTPRLSNIASNLEECMGTMHRYIEMRWGFSEPESTVSWTRHFDLRTTMEKIRSVFEILALASAQSPELVGELVLSALESEALIPDGDKGDALKQTIRDEIEAGARARTQENALFSEFGV